MGGTRGRNGAQAFNLIHVFENTVLHSVVPVGAHEPISYVDADETARILQQNGVVIAPARPTPVYGLDAVIYSSVRSANPERFRR